MNQIEVMEAYATPAGLIVGPWCLWMGRRIEHNVRRKQFDRRNESGVEIFASYDDMRRLRSREGTQHTIASLLSIGGYALLFFAFLNFVSLNS